MIRMIVLFLVVLAAACTDVGRCRVGSEGCVCDAARACADGLVCVRDEDVCAPASSVVCEDSCVRTWNRDGLCDDGGPGSTYAACGLGSDCSDCGGRRNPCTDPEFPVYCTATSGVPARCWSAGTDCDSIAYCADDVTVSGACHQGSTFDCAAQSCAPNPCTNPEAPVFCSYGDSCDASPGSCCFPPGADCRTTTDCFGDWYACLGRLAEGAPLVLVCGADPSAIDCVAPTP